MENLRSSGGFLTQKNRLAPVYESFLLFLSRSTYGAGFGAGAALDAGFRIDFVFSVSFADGGYGALGSASAAADAFIGNFVSHIAPPNY